jgi:hypothetical protein
VPHGTPIEKVIEALLDLDPDWENKALRAFDVPADQPTDGLPALD